jgi:hypothetical protein
MIANYIDSLPRIPQYLLGEIQRIITTKKDELEKFAGGKHWAYQFYPIDGELEDWLLTNIPIEKTDCFHIHVITKELVIHKDYNSKKYKLNYIFETGGDDVLTGFYDDNKNLLESVCFKSNRWHHFDGTVFHGVTGIEELKKRIGLTLGTEKDFKSFVV